MSLLNKQLGILLLSVATFSATAYAAGDTLTGKVLETMNVDSYTYMKVKTDSGEMWAAVPKTKVKVGSNVEVANPMTMDGFESKTLKRKFDHIVFGTLASGGAAADTKASAGAGMASMGMGAMGGGAKLGPVPFSKIKVTKAEGAEGRTIEEIYAQKAELKGKPVAVRGKVVKFTGGVMGVNWIHIHDGTGKEADKTYDLTVSSNDNTKVGDTILVKGVLTADKDLGAGYFYPVLVEKAKISK